MPLTQAAWTWNNGTPRERGEMVRQHISAPRENLLSLFQLTPDGLDKILSGDDWRPEYEMKDR